MNQIKAKVYYLIITGEVILITSEMQGCIEETTKKEDMQNFFQLKDYTEDQIDFIELEYGTLATVLNNLKSYSVDVSNKKFNCVYFTQEELDVQKQVILDQQAVQARIATVSDYIAQNTSTIDDFENTIIQIELAKIENGDV